MTAVDGSSGSLAVRRSRPHAPPRRAPWVGAEPPVVQVVGAAAVVLLLAAASEIAVADTIGTLFGTILVLASIGCALLVRPGDLFTAGVLPPLLLLALLVVLAVVHPDGVAVPALDPSASLPQRVIAGFVDLAGALVLAHALALLVVALRVRAVRRRGRDQGSGPSRPISLEAAPTDRP